MNLEKLNLVELDAQEVENTEGGLIYIYPVTLMALYENAKNNLKAGLGILAGIGDGYNSGLND